MQLCPNSELARRVGILRRGRGGAGEREDAAELGTVFFFSFEHTGLI